MGYFSHCHSFVPFLSMYSVIPCAKQLTFTINFFVFCKKQFEHKTHWRCGTHLMVLYNFLAIAELVLPPPGPSSDTEVPGQELLQQGPVCASPDGVWGAGGGHTSRRCSLLLVGLLDRFLIEGGACLLVDTLINYFLESQVIWVILFLFGRAYHLFHTIAIVSLNTITVMPMWKTALT